MEAGPNSADRQRLDTMRRRRLFRDLVAFQVKLLVDALKDLLLSPVALVAAVMDFLGPQPRPAMHFYQVLDFGRRLEARIDLFGVRGRGRGQSPDWTVDEVLQQVESRFVDHQKTSKKSKKRPGDGDEGR
jgi:hypothetical protein